MHPAQSNPVPELRTDPVTLSMYILAEQHIKARAPALCTEPPARFACVSKMSTRPCRPRTRAGASASCSTPSVSPASSWRPQFARRAVVPGFTNHVAACVLPLLSFVGNAGRAGGCPGDGRFGQCAGARSAHAARVPLRMQPGTVCSAGCQAQGEDQKKLDILANEVFINLLTKCGQCAVLVSGPPPPGPCSGGCPPSGSQTSLCGNVPGQRGGRRADRGGCGAPRRLLRGFRPAGAAPGAAPCCPARPGVTRRAPHAARAARTGPPTLTAA